MPISCIGGWSISVLLRNGKLETRAGVPAIFFFKLIADLFLRWKVLHANHGLCQAYDLAQVIMSVRKGISAHVMALMIKEFPGSWLPTAQKWSSEFPEPHL